MSETLSLFTTRVHRAVFPKAGALNDDIVAAALSFAEDDEAGRRWSEEKAGRPLVGGASVSTPAGAASWASTSETVAVATW